MSLAQEIEDWLFSSWDRSKRRSRLNLQQQPCTMLDALEVAKIGESRRYTLEVRDESHGKPWRISYTISNVVIESRCEGGHNFGEWKYDYMGGDVRSCSECGLTEYE